MSANWEDVAAKIPQGISEDKYNQIRNYFFKEKIAPNMQPGDDPHATYDAFIKRTDRTAFHIGESAANLAAMTVAAELPGGLVGDVVRSFGLPGAVAKIATGGATWAAFNAMQAKDGDRAGAALRGATVGALVETGLGAVLGFGEKAMASTVKDAMTDGAKLQVESPSIDKAVAETVEANVKEARKQGMTTGPVVVNPAQKGMMVVTSDAEGVRAITHVPRGKESEVTGIVEEILAKGGSLDEIHTNPASHARAMEFSNYFAQKAEAADATVTVKTPEGKAQDVAKEMNGNGVTSTVVDDSTVKAGPAPPEPQPDTTGEKATPPDEVSKTMQRIGELRNQIRLAGGNRAEHAELHNLAGTVGQKFGLTRTQVGQIGLNYFERGLEGEAGSATDMLEKYRGAGKDFGVTEGEKPPRGFDEASRLPGFRIPTSEQVEWDTDPMALTGELRMRPVGTTKRVAHGAEELGWSGAQVRGRSGPMRVLAADATASDAYHEAVHDGLEHADLTRDFLRLTKPHIETMQGIMGGLKRAFTTYADYPVKNLANEAFTHAAEAIRMGDEAKLDQIARWDTSVDKVKEFVNTTAGRAYEASLSADTQPVRAFQRRMNDLVRRTSPYISHELNNAQKFGYTTWFDPELSQWVMRDGEGREILKENATDVWDHIDQADPSSHFPDVAHQAYFKGVQGPLVPPGMEPVEGTSTPEIPHVPLGFQSLAALTRPANEAFAGIQKKFDAAGVAVKYFEGYADIRDAAREASRVMSDRAQGFEDIIKGVPHERSTDYGEILSRPATAWSDMSKTLNLSDKDLANVRLISDWDDAEMGGKLKQTLQTLRQAREVGGDAKRFGGAKDIKDAIKNEHLGYSDLNVARTKQWVLRNQYEAAVNPAIDVFKKEIDRLPRNSTAAKNAKNYINHVLSIPDASQQIFDEFIQGTENGMNRWIANRNKSLPEGMQIPKANLKSFWPTVRSLMFAGGLGGRASVMIRDTFQGLFGMTVIGPEAFAKGMARATTKEGRALAEEAGALMHGRNVGQFWGDITGEIPTTGRVSQYVNRMANTLLTPNRIGHNIGRLATFLGEHDNALEQLSRFRSGEIGLDELINRTHVSFHQGPETSRLLGMAADPTKSVQEVAKAFGLAATEATQFGGAPGMILRTGMGRILGQFASWPMNHIEFTRKLATWTVNNPRKGIPAIGMWAALNYGAFEAASAAGIDVTKWLWQSPAGWTGSPAEQLVQNIFKAPEESTEGRQARRDILEFPLDFVPTGVELRDLYKAADSGDLSVPTLLGFRPMKDQPEDPDLDDWILRESGFKR